MPSVELHHVVAGAADGPVIVLLHSIGTTLALWDGVVPALAAGCRRVVRADLRGHGRSPVPPGPYAMADLAGDVVALLDRLGVERATLAGVSLGGMVALRAALDAPDRVEGLVAVCTSPHLPPPSMWAERAAIAREHGPGALSDAVVPRWLTPAFAAAHPDAVEALRAQLAATPGEGYAGCAEAIGAMDLRGELGRIRARTLVGAGDDDPATPPDGHASVIADAIPGARLEVLPGVAHQAPVEAPGRVAALLGV